MKKYLYTLLLSLGISVSLSGCGMSEFEKKEIIALEKNVNIEEDDQLFIKHFLANCDVDYDKDSIDFDGLMNKNENGWHIVYVASDFTVNMAYDYDSNGKIDDLYKSSILLPVLSTTMYQRFKDLSIGKRMNLVRVDNGKCFINLLVENESLFYNIANSVLKDSQSVAYSFQGDNYTLVRGFATDDEAQLLLYHFLAAYFYDYYYYGQRPTERQIQDESNDIQTEELEDFDNIDILNYEKASNSISLTLQNNEDKI